MEKILVIILLITILVSCNFKIHAQNNEIDEFNEKFVEVLKKSSTDYNYNFLGTLEYGEYFQQLYLMFDKLCIEFITNYDEEDNANYNMFGLVMTNIPYEISELYEKIDFYRMFSYMIEAYKRDNPLMYFVHESYASSLTTPNDKLTEIQITIDKYDPKEKYEFNQTIYQKMIEYSSYTEGVDSQYTKAVILNKIICDNMYYEYDEFGNFSRECHAHNVLGFFIYGKGVCETYAYTFSALMNYVGVECFYVNGNYNEKTNISHAWNIAKMNNGEWYWFDIDKNDDDEKGYERKTYLCFNTDANTLSEAYYIYDIYYSYISVPKLSTSSDDVKDWYTITLNDVLYEIDVDRLFVLDNPKQNEIPETIELKWKTFTTACIHEKVIDKDNCKYCLNCLQSHLSILQQRSKEATCTEDGLTGGKKCGDCGKILEEQKVIPKTGHNLTDWIIDLEPTKESSGYRHKECINCKEVIEEERMPKLGGCSKKANALYSLLLLTNFTCFMFFRKRK